MTTRITIENGGPADLGVSPIYPDDPLVGTRNTSVRVRAYTRTEFYVHAGQSLVINEVTREERATA